MNDELILKTIEQENLIYLTFDELVDAVSKFTKILPNKIKQNVIDMLESGDLGLDEKGYIFVSEKRGYLKGKLIGHRKGYGFVDISDEDIKDIFIPYNAMNGAIDGDIVLVKVINRPENSNPEGRIIRVISRTKNFLAGTVKKQRDKFILIPDNDKFDDIQLKKQGLTNFADGDKVVAELLLQEKNERLKGSVVEVLGKSGTIKAEQLAIIRSYDLRESFAPAVLEEAKKVAVKISEKEILRRVDLRHLKTVTVDGEDARDFDDAISVQLLDNGNRLVGVHIADVAHFVKAGGAIDTEAFKRGTSVYFPDMVLPMLPVELSNGVCSLLPDEDRLTLSVLMELDKNCKVVSHEICESVIRSKARMTYNEVWALLNKDEKMLEKYALFVDDFEIFASICKKLQQQRERRGEIRFDIPEPYIKIGSRGEIVSIEKRDNNLSHQIIESLMVLCNEVIAEHFFKAKLPFVYRVHEKPDVTKQETFLKFIKLQGVTYKMNGSELLPKDYQNILNGITDDDKKSVINKILLRTMMKARYSPNCLGHFGLASTFYCHFTSPIRRYPDLTIHRIIKASVSGQMNKSAVESYLSLVEKASEQSSLTETIATEVEREVDDYKKAVYMTQFIGCEYEGVISSVQEFGLFVELDNTVEGLIRFDSLPIDNYDFDEVKMELKGKTHCFALGGKVEIVVVNTNVKLRQITFELKSEYERHADIKTVEKYADTNPKAKINLKDYVIIKEKQFRNKKSNGNNKSNHKFKTDYDFNFKSKKRETRDIKNGKSQFKFNKPKQNSNENL